MKRNIDYYEGNEENTDVIPNVTSAMELQELIEQKISNEPAKGKLHAIWKREVNNLIDVYNTSYGHIYKYVK